MYRKNRWMKITRFIYDGAVTASVDMTEANFEAEDVVLTVWKDWHRNLEGCSCKGTEDRQMTVKFLNGL